MVYGKKERKIQKRYREKHREELRERDRQRYKENPDFFREKTRKWRKRNYKKWIKKNRKREQRRLKVTMRDKKNYQKWREKNRDRINEQARIRYKKNPENMANHQKKYYKKNRKKVLERNRKHYLKNIDAMRKKDRKYWRIFGKRRMKWYVGRFKAFQKISGKRIPRCEKCGERRFILLSINHINGLGKGKHKERIHLFRKINKGKRKTNDLEIRCHNCNFLYEFERGRCFFDKKLFVKRLKKEKIIHLSDKIK
jgi:DNA-directed RNA polymerase subunit RPC12/RpoP